MKKFKEWLRKRMVTLKRRPYYIPLVMLIVSCLALNLKLTSFSNTIAQINEPGMGLCIFVIVLFSYLSIISFATAFPNRKKPKIMSIIVSVFMIIASIACEFLFNYYIRYGTEIKKNPIVITPEKAYINVARQTGMLHCVLLGITLLLILTLPFYKKLLRKINTSIVVESSVDAPSFHENNEEINH